MTRLPFAFLLPTAALLVASPAAAQQRMTPQDSAAPNQALTPASPPPSAAPVVGPPNAGTVARPATPVAPGGSHAGTGPGAR